MALSTLTRQQIRQRVAGSAGLRGIVTGTASDDGTATVQAADTLVDASADGVKDTAWDAARFDGGYLAAWAGAAATAYEWSRFAENGLTPSTGAMQIGRNFATPPVTALTQWEAHTHGCTPDELHDYIKWACRSLMVDEWLALPGLVADGNMEDSGVTNWTGTNATVTKTTAEANVARGAQALSVVTTAANGYAESPSIPVGESKGYRIFALVKTATAGGTASIVVRDHTNGADITVSWANLQNVVANDYGDYRLLAGSFETPGGCVNVRLRLQNDTITTTSFFDDVLLYPVDAHWLSLPTWLTDPDAQLIDVYSDRYLNTGKDDYVRTKLRPYYGAYGTPGGQTAYRLAVPVGMIAPVVIHAARPLTEPTSDASTIPEAYGDHVVTGALFKAYEAGARPKGVDAKEFAAERTRVQRDWWGYVANTNPRLRAGGSPVKTRLPSTYWSGD